MVNANFEEKFPGLVAEIWGFVSSAAQDVEGHFATYLPAFGLFDRIELHLDHEFLCLVARDTHNDITEFAVLKP